MILIVLRNEGKIKQGNLAIKLSKCIADRSHNKILLLLKVHYTAVSFQQSTFPVEHPLSRFSLLVFFISTAIASLYTFTVTLNLILDATAFTHQYTDTLSTLHTHATKRCQYGLLRTGWYVYFCRPNPVQGLSPMQCELSVECALEARLAHLVFPSPSHSLFTQVIKIELKDTNANAYSSTSSPSFPSFTGSASSAESYQSQRHNVKYFAGYARFNQSKQSAQELLMCVCVLKCIQI